jgi:phospholipid/cholesterol/gamma-HCH transport system substrate-binding protein
MKGTTTGTEFRVGLFVLLGFMAIAAFSFRLTESPIFQQGIEVTTYLDDATGLFKLTKVKQAGISIGYVKEIELENNRAKLTLVIDQGYSLPRGARVLARPLGVLGDKFLDVKLPGQEDGKAENEGEPTQPKDSHTSFRSIWKKLWEAAIPTAAAQTPPKPKSGKAMLKQGDVIEAAESTGSVDDLTRDASDISKDIKATSTSVRTLVQNNASEIESLIRSWNRITIKLEKTLNKIDSDKVSNDLKDISEAAGRASRSLKNIEEITDKIDKGDGTLGKLVNDPTTVQELNRTLSHLNNAIERSRRIQTLVDMNGDYRGRMKSTKTWVGLTIMTRETSGYIAQVVIDPVGKEKRVVTSTTTNGGAASITETVTNDRSALKYSVQFYKRIGDTAFRLGLFENSGGLGVDAYLWGDKVQLTTEFYEIGRAGDNPHLRAFARVPFWTFLYAQAGGDEIITKMNSLDRKPSWTVGLGLRFTDDDIKTLFLLPGIP